MGRSMIMMVVIASCLALDTWVFLVGHLAHAESEVPATSPFSGDEAAIEEGGSWFRAVCAPCHGIRADGRGERGQAANLKKFKKGFRQYVTIVKNGREVQGRSVNMPRWGGVLSDELIYKIGAFLETLALEEANWGEPTKATN